MTRTILLRLKDFDDTSLPSTLTALKSPKDKMPITVELKDLFHHYYKSKYGDCALDTGNYEYQRRLTSDPDWRFSGDGIGCDKEAKRNASNELGKAFARWFLDKYFDITYFAPFESVLGKPYSDGSVWGRKSKGDLPDYICGKNQNDINLLEAKGRYNSVGFDAKEFQEFRDQIQRASFIDKSKNSIAVKGYISVARWATESNARIQSMLSVEDPFTDGQPPADGKYPSAAGKMMITHNYISTLERLRLFEFSLALQLNRPLKIINPRRLGKWQCDMGSLQGVTFIGGVINSCQTQFAWPYFYNDFFIDHWNFFKNKSPFFIESPMQFFGVEEHIFLSIIKTCREGIDNYFDIKPIEVNNNVEQISLLRDGTILGAAEYFRPIGILEF